MDTSTIRRHRLVLAGCATVAVAGTLALATPNWVSSAADTDCTAATLAHTVSGVTNNVGTYLDGHPDVNAAFTNLKGEPRPQLRADAEKYLSANPGVRSDLQGLRAPITDLAQRCGVVLPAGPLGF